MNAIGEAARGVGQLPRVVAEQRDVVGHIDEARRAAVHAQTEQQRRAALDHLIGVAEPVDIALTRDRAADDVAEYAQRVDLGRFPLALGPAVFDLDPSP